MVAKIKKVEMKELKILKTMNKKGLLSKKGKDLLKKYFIKFLLSKGATKKHAMELSSTAVNKPRTKLKYQGW